MFDHLDFKKLAKDRSLRLVAVFLIAILAFPEATIAIDLFAALDIMGAELFLLAMLIGARMLPYWTVLAVKKLIYRIDPYFFLPRWFQLRQCPALSAHAVPLFVPVCLAAALWWGSVQLDTP